MSVNLDCDAHHHGVLLLGPPLPEQSYNRQEAEALQQVANEVAQAVCIAMPRYKST